MKSNDFLNEGIVEDAHEMHQDHEVQMAREECYHAASDAIILHKLLKHISEQQGIEGWVAAKITLAADYLNTVREYVEYELMSGHQEQMADAQPALPVAEGVITADDFKTITEVNPHDFDSDEDYYAARNAPPKRRSAPSDYPYSPADDEAYFREIWRKNREAKAKQDKGVAEGSLQSQIGDIELTDFYLTDETGKILAGPFDGRNDAMPAYRKLASQGVDVDLIQGRALIMKLHGLREQGVAEGAESLSDWETRMKKLGYKITKDNKSGTYHAWDGTTHKGSHKTQGVAEEAGTKGFRVTWSEAGSDKHTSGLLLKHHAIEHAKMLKNKPGTSNVKIVPYRSMGLNASLEQHADDKMKELGHKFKPVAEMSAGSVATVVNPTPKNKAKTGTLFGGTYKQPKARK